jgi:hypothetical protein
LSFRAVAHPVTVTIQQQHEPSYNSFGSLPGEQMLREWTLYTGTCSTTTIYRTILTDTRLLILGKHDLGSAIFLRDIHELEEVEDEEPNVSHYIGRIFCCTWLCYYFLGACRQPKNLVIRGVFGRRFLHLSNADRANAKIEISLAIAKQKAFE